MKKVDDVLRVHHVTKSSKTVNLLKPRGHVMHQQV